MRIAVDGVRSAERDPRGGVLRQTAVVGEGSGDEQDIACRQFGRFRTEVGDAGPAVGYGLPPVCPSAPSGLPEDRSQSSQVRVVSAVIHS